MQAPTAGFWGKLDRDEATGVVRGWHPLLDHCADVAAVAEALLALPTWSRRLSAIADRPLDDTARARLAALCALHDVGKFNLGFQGKGRPELGLKAGHVAEGVAIVCRSGTDRVARAFDPEPLQPWGEEACYRLLLAAICHHGRPLDVRQAQNEYQASWWTPAQGLDPLGGIATLRRQIEVWFPAAFAGDTELPNAPRFEHAFAGLVMLADWIGSDRSFFPYREPGDPPDRMAFAREQAQSVLRWMGLDVEAARPALAGRDPFEAVSEHDPGPAQRAARDLSPPRGEGTITAIEAETGSGKTEAALCRFAALFAAGAVDGLYFALPTRTAASQMFRRVRTAVARAFPDAETRPAVVLAVPGYLRVDDVEGRRLPGFEVHWPDEPGARHRHRAWAAENPKRFLAGAVVVGTVDQVLLSALRVSHAHLRATAALRHLLVVDEVHASDAYMTAVLRQVLRRHLAAGGHALLLSATLGASARVRLLHPDRTEPLPGHAESRAADYPLVSHRDGDVQAFPVAHGGRSREVHVAAVPAIADPEAIASRAVEHARRGAKVLVIRNTVRGCVAVQREVERALGDASDLVLRCEGVPAPHHGRYARADREKLDDALERRLGRDRPEGGAVIVATQTVQQSLDLDADVLITDLCPIDVLLQRIGRLHRHNRGRPDGHSIATAWILVPEDRDLGLLLGEGGRARSLEGLGGEAYPDLCTIEGTWRTIENRPVWVLPRDCRELVEDCLHPEALERAANVLGPRGLLHARHVAGTSLAHARLADLNLVDDARSYVEAAFGDTDRHISSRLGEGDRLLHFDPAPSGPFGAPVGHLALPAWMAGHLGPKVEAPDEIAVREGGFDFRAGARWYTYDRLGLRFADAADAKAGGGEDDA